jgi:hypothetical protein
MDARSKTAWDKAMDWWRNNPHSMIIRNLACNRMIQRGCEEIGSSDINHTVYSMWCEWERTKSQYPSEILYLVDYANS